MGGFGVNTKAKFLVLAGFGINCERESARSLEMAGLGSEVVYLFDLLDNPSLLGRYQGLFLPGGFSFGDDLGSGRVLAMTMERRLRESLWKFRERGRPILGVCNGFQVLVELGFLPGPDPGQAVIASNSGGAFIDEWVEIGVEGGGPWFGCFGKRRIRLPIRHAEGRIVFRPGFDEESVEASTALRYIEDVNGSHGRIAGMVDKTGLVLGMMPHPEAAVSVDTSPLGRHQDPSNDGLLFFQSIAYYLREV